MHEAAREVFSPLCFSAGGIRIKSVFQKDTTNIASDNTVALSAWLLSSNCCLPQQ